MNARVEIPSVEELQSAVAEKRSELHELRDLLEVAKRREKRKKPIVPTAGSASRSVAGVQR